MLGTQILDPDGAESTGKSAGPAWSEEGLGLLDITTTIESEKATYRIEATVSNPFSSTEEEFRVDGYEVHMGRSTLSSTPSTPPSKEKERPFGRITTRNRDKTEILDGAVSADSRVWGSYIHGLFDSDPFRASIIESIREAKGLAPTPARTTSFAAERDSAYDTLAEVLRQSLDMEAILKIMGLESGIEESDRKLLRTNTIQG